MTTEYLILELRRLNPHEDKAVIIALDAEEVTEVKLSPDGKSIELYTEFSSSL